MRYSINRISSIYFLVCCYKQDVSDMKTWECQFRFLKTPNDIAWKIYIKCLIKRLGLKRFSYEIFHATGTVYQCLRLILYPSPVRYHHAYLAVETPLKRMPTAPEAFLRSATPLFARRTGYAGTKRPDGVSWWIPIVQRTRSKNVSSEGKTWSWLVTGKWIVVGISKGIQPLSSIHTMHMHHARQLPVGWG